MKQSKAIKLLTSYKTDRTLDIFNHISIMHGYGNATDLESTLSIYLDNVTGEGLVHKDTLKVIGDNAASVSDKAMTLHATGMTYPCDADKNDFPSFEYTPMVDMFEIKASVLLELISKSKLHMADKDVRYYLNGMLITSYNGKLRLVATDGHRMSIIDSEVDYKNNADIIVPRSTVLLIEKVLKEDQDCLVSIVGNDKFIQLTDNKHTWMITSKLVEGKFPEYNRVIPKNLNKRVTVKCDSLSNAIKALKPLLNAKYSGVVLDLEHGTIAPSKDFESPLRFCDGVSEGVKIGFNALYLNDVLKSVDTDNIDVEFVDANSSVLINGQYIVMPMRL